MRLWSLHPRYLDAKGLTALWREGLLARKVLQGKTKGYKNHPQLERFKKHPDPLAAIEVFLVQVYKESCLRGYCFDKNKITVSETKIQKIKVTSGQVEYEFSHLLKKLKLRDIKKYRSNTNLTGVETNSVFRIIAGPIEKWEML